MKTYFFPGSLTLHIKIEYKSAYLSSSMFLPSPWTHKMRSSEFSLFSTSFSAKQCLACSKQGWKLIPQISTIPVEHLNFGSRVINIAQIQAKADLVTTTIYYYQHHRNHTCHTFFFKKHNQHNTAQSWRWIQCFQPQALQPWMFPAHFPPLLGRQKFLLRVGDQ